MALEKVCTRFTAGFSKPSIQFAFLARRNQLEFSVFAGFCLHKSRFAEQQEHIHIFRKGAGKSPLTLQFRHINSKIMAAEDCPQGWRSSLAGFKG
jgi:hypothetical protein